MAITPEHLEPEEMEENVSRGREFCEQIYWDLIEEMGEERFWSLVNEMGPERGLPSVRDQDDMAQMVEQNLLRKKPAHRERQLELLWDNLLMLCGHVPEHLDTWLDLRAYREREVVTMEALLLNTAWKRRIEGSRAERQPADVIQRFLDFEARAVYMLYKTVQKADTPNWFSLSKDLAMALLATDLSAVYSEDIQLPFPGFYIEPPPGVFKIRDDLTDEYVDVVAIGIAEEVFPEARDDVELIARIQSDFIGGRRLLIKLIGAPRESERAKGIYDGPEGYFSVPLAAGREISEMLAEEQSLLEEDERRDEEERRRAGESHFTKEIGSIYDTPLAAGQYRDRIYSFVLNVLLYITSKDAQVQKTAKDIKAKKKGKKSKKARLREMAHGGDWLLGSKVVIDPSLRRAVEESGGGARWKLKYQVFVRGHWRKQPYGPGRKLRRPKWIYPYVKGKGRLPGPALGHRYEDPGVSPQPGEPDENPGPRIPLKTAEELGLTPEELEEQTRLADEVIDELLEEEESEPEENPLGVEMAPTLLEDDFDPRLLEAGLYRAYSNTPAFPLLWGMTVTGDAAFGGYKYHEGGVVEILAGIDIVGEAEANPEVERWQAAVTIPHEAFTSIPEEEYGQATWQQMWWREVIQNAVDAGANKIDCDVEQQPDGSWLARCADNGHGMDAEGIINLFFRLKATRKFGSMSIGGFGEAKKFIALAWIKFRVRSQDAEVSGSGATWPNLDASKGHPKIKGTIVEVVMPQDKHTTEAAAVDFISKCNLPGIKFTVNGTPRQAKMRPRNFKKELAYDTKLYWDKRGTVNGAVVRANGLYMFTKDLPSDFKGTVFIELFPRQDRFPRPKDLFSATRMDFGHNELADEVRQFLQKARSDVREAMRDPDALVREEYRGIGKFEITQGQAARVRDVAGPLPEKAPGGGLRMTDAKQGEIVEVIKEAHQDAVDTVGGDETKLIGVADVDIASILAGLEFRGESHLEAAAMQLVWKPDFLIMNDETMRDRFKIDKRFEPATMTGPVLALAKCWAEFVRLVFIASGTSARWGVGFVFSTEALGMFQSQGRNKKYICLNPFDLNTGKLLSIRDERQLSQVFAIAIHECAHYIDGYDYHSEGWREAVDRLMGILMRYWPQAKRIAKSIKIRGAIPSVKERKKQVASMAEVYAWWMTRGLQAALVVAPFWEKDVKELSREYLVPEDFLEVFLYDDFADKFVDGIKNEERATKLLAALAMEDEGVPVVVERAVIDQLMLESFSPTKGLRIWPASRDQVPIHLWLRSDGALAMRLADRRMIRELMPSDSRDIPMSATTVVFAWNADVHEGLEDLIERILTRAGIEHESVEDNEMRMSLMGGHVLTLPFSSSRFMELLDLYLEGIRTWEFTDFDNDVPHEVPSRGHGVRIDLQHHDDGTYRLEVLDESDRKWYGWVHDLGVDQPLIIDMKQKWERERFLGLVPKYVQEAIEEPGTFFRPLELSREFFDRLIDFHAEGIRNERGRRPTADEAVDMGAPINVTLEPLGRMQEVVVAWPTLGERKQSEVYDVYPESHHWPLRYFLYDFEDDSDDLVLMGLLERLKVKGVASADFGKQLVDRKINEMFGEEVTLKPSNFIPVTIWHKKNESGEDVLRMAPADLRVIRFLEQAYGIERGLMPMSIVGQEDVEDELERMVNDTTTDPDKRATMISSFWKDNRILVLEEWDSYLEALKAKAEMAQ
jgi:hypothetical protein